MLRRIAVGALKFECVQRRKKECLHVLPSVPNRHFDEALNCEGYRGEAVGTDSCELCDSPSRKMEADWTSKDSLSVDRAVNIGW